jgi:hypothetical protein
MVGPYFAPNSRARATLHAYHPRGHKVNVQSECAVGGFRLPNSFRGERRGINCVAPWLLLGVQGGDRYTDQFPQMHLALGVRD